MRDKDLYAQILGVQKPWTVTDVALDRDAGKVEVFVKTNTQAKLVCPHCQKACSRYDKRSRRWRHLDTCQFQTILVADVPRVSCEEHGISQVQVPWAEPGSGFTALFEALVIDWLQEASVNAVRRQLGLSWDCVDGIMERAVKRGLARRDVSELYPDLDVDEISIKRGHRYVTIVSDPGQRSVIHVCEERKKAGLKSFYQALSREQKEAICTVAMDMWPAFINATREEIDEAESKIVFDKFHIAKHLGEAVDKVRRDEHRQLKQQGNSILTGTKYDWLRNPNNRSVKQNNSFRSLMSGTLRTARAWAWKESAMCLWHYRSKTWARKGWERWYAGAIRSRLEPIKRVARMIKNHLWGIINAVVTGASNAGAESLNSRIRIVTSQSRGFRNTQRFIRTIYFHFGGLDLYPESVTR